jgi:hypothetical protein
MYGAPKSHQNFYPEPEPYQHDAAPQHCENEIYYYDFNFLTRKRLKFLLFPKRFALHFGE